MGKSNRIPELNDGLLIEIMTKSVQNAKDLIEDGHLLYAKERYQRAYALYQLANEELGKALFSMVHLISDYKDYADRINWYNRTFYDHKPKSITSTDIDLIAVSSMFVGHPEEFAKFYKHHLGFSAEIDHDQMERNRMNCFYVDVVDGKVLVPSDLITKEMCTKLQTMVITRHHTASHSIKIAVETYIVIREDFEKNPELIDVSPETIKKKAADRIKGKTKT